jgi:2-dehydropantoate 2-reductase
MGLSLEHPVIAVIGAGAVGGYYGARLAQGGHDVHLHMRSDWQTVRASGLRVESLDGDFELPASRIHAYGNTTEMPPADLIIVTLKTTANPLLKSIIAPVLKPDSAIITLQNGLGNEQILAGLFGAHRVLGGMAFVCINRIAPGFIRHLDHGLIALAEFQGAATRRAHRLAELFSASKIPCRVISDLNRGRWEKLIWNVPFNGLGAVLDQTTDQLINNPNGLVLVRLLMQDVINAADSVGIGFEQTIIEEKIEHTRTMGAYKTSMQVDCQLNRPMEIQMIVGEPLRIATKKNIVSHYIEMVYNMLMQIDAGRV